MIEPQGPESPPPGTSSATRRPGLGFLIAAVLVAALVSGAVAAGVTLAVLRYQSRTNPQDLNLGSHVTISEDNSAAQVASKALPAVVSVVTDERVPTYGSGFLVTTDGYIVTNTAVVANSTSLTILIANDARRHDGRLVDFDCRTGLAVLKIDQVSNLPTLPFGDSGALRAGQIVIALGGPLEDHVMVTKGVVTALHRRAVVGGSVITGRETEYSDTVQTDANIGSGNSGGPLLNVGGQVVGVNMAATQGGQPVGFALSSNGVEPELQQLLQSGQFLLPSLGLTSSDLGPEESALRNLAAGSLIVSIQKGGPADEAGLRVGDVITQLDDTRLDSAHPLHQVLLSRFRPAQRVAVTFSRGGSSNQVQATLRAEHPQC